MNWTATHWRGRSASTLALQAHNRLHARFPGALWHGRTDRPEIALTFDDGPHRADTPQVLELLARHGVQSTFFVVGKRVRRAPELVRMAAGLGHQIGLHGYHHRPFTLETGAMLRKELHDTQALVLEECGPAAGPANCVRPPFGLFLPATLRNLAAWGYQPVMWNVVPFHWLQPAQTSVRQVLQQTANGSLLVLHEGLAGPPVATLLEPILLGLKDAGFRFITVDAMRQSLIESGRTQGAA